jgi:hypothetical protein
MRQTLCLAPFLLIAFCITTYAHHDEGAIYKVKEATTIEGKVVQFLYRSPHCWVEVRAAAPDGRLWSLEWMSAKKLRKLGIEGNTLQLGDDLIITANPTRHPNERRMLIQMIKRQSDGFTWSKR